MKAQGIGGFAIKCLIAAGIGGPTAYFSVREGIKDGVIDIEQKVQTGVEKGTDGLENRVQSGIKLGINQVAEDIEPRVEVIEKRLRTGLSTEVDKGAAQIEDRVRRGVKQGIREGLGVEKKAE